MRQPLKQRGPEPVVEARDAWEAPGLSDAQRFLHLLMGLGHHRSLRDPMAALCEDLQLTPAQVHVLAWLGYDGPLAMGLLAARAGVNEKTLTGVVDRLERDGYTVRLRAAEDRRTVTVSLTDAGTELYARLQDVSQRKLEGLMDLLGAEDREALFGILGRLLHRLQQRAASGPA